MLGANKSSGRRTQQPVPVPIAANSTAGPAPIATGYQRPRWKPNSLAPGTGRRNALDTARAGKKLAGGVPARPKRRFAAPIGADAPPRSRRIRRRLAVAPRSNSSRREECLVIVPVDLPNDLGELVRQPLRKMKKM